MRRAIDFDMEGKNTLDYQRKIVFLDFLNCVVKVEGVEVGDKEILSDMKRVREVFLTNHELYNEKLVEVKSRKKAWSDFIDSTKGDYSAEKYERKYELLEAWEVAEKELDDLHSYSSERAFLWDFGREFVLKHQKELGVEYVGTITRFVRKIKEIRKNNKRAA